MKYLEPEFSTLEWKRELPTKEQIIKTVIGFCNRYGGKLVVGVANNGDVIGIDEETIQEQMEFLDKMIYESCAPPIIPLIYAQRIGDRNILIIEVIGTGSLNFLDSSIQT